MKKISQLFVVLCVVLLFSSCASTNAQYADATHEIDVFVEDFDSLDDVNPRSYIMIEINGTQYNAMFDTGDYNGGITLPNAEIEKLVLEQTETQTAMRATSAPVERNLYSIPQMRIGDNLLVYDVVCSTEPSAEGIGEDVIIGLQSFKELYNILISYKQQKIYLWEKSYVPPFLSEWTKLPMADSNDLLVNGTVDGKPYVFVLDTGSPGYSNGTIYDISFEKFGSSSTKTITLGDREFTTNFWYIETPYKDMMPFDIVLGALFYDYDVFIDFDNAMVYIEN